MPAALNHTIVYCRDQAVSSRFLTDLLGLSPPGRFGPFVVVTLANGVSLDYLEVEQVNPQHYAFLVSEDEFEEIKARIIARGRTFWADPARRHENQLNTADGGRGLYWADPDDHLLEIITVPYGGWPTA